jgi:hypothetical protein
MSSTAKRVEEEQLPDTSLLAVQMDQQFWDLMDKDYLGEGDLAYIAAKYCPKDEARRQVFDRIRKVKAGTFKEDGWELPDTGQGPELDPGANDMFRDWFKEFAIRQYGELVHTASLDPLSRIGVLSASRESAYKTYDAFSPDLWTCWIAPGIDGYCVGPKRSGKTSKMSLISKLAIDKGTKVLGALTLHHEVPGYTYAPNATTLVRNLCAFKLAGNKLVLVDIDEAFISYSGETPLATKVMNLRKLTRLFGHLEASTLVATQYFRELPSELKMVAKFRCHSVSKRQPDRANIQLEGMLGGRLEEWSGRVKYFPDGPPHTLPYKTEAMAAFTMDFDPGVLFDHLAELPMNANQFEATLRWLDDKGLHIKPREKRWFARRGAAEGISQSVLARVVGVSQPTISRWVAQDEAASRLDEDMGTV